MTNAPTPLKTRAQTTHDRGANFIRFGWDIESLLPGFRIRPPVCPVRPAVSMRQPVDKVIHPKLVGFVRVIKRPESSARPLPELGDVRVVVHDHLQPLPGIIVFEQPPKDRS